MNITNYTVLKEETIKEVNGTAYFLEHNQTKAKVLLVINDDDNKVFHIGFRTPPADDTGVAHITEHSVLCGSKKFPAKDPFVELAKGSLNTFLNAMTYPDKTVYPIASVNAKDFHNLMHVYLDAVFYPNTYKNEKIMKQEGWHYELLSLDGELTYNGVVYNEMKGAYSSDEQLLMQTIQRSLFPDTTYGCDSGGDPAHITELTREDFLDFHKKYYHPSNSFLYLYGDMDYEKELAFIDEEYLSKFEYQEVNSVIRKQMPFDCSKEIYTQYPLSEAEDAEGKTYLSYNVVFENGVDRRRDLAFSMLDYALIDVPGAPLRQAIIDAGISEDVFSSYDGAMFQPVYSIVAKDCKTEDKERFITIIETVLSDLIENGMEEKVLRAALNHFEFKNKEANYGRYPKGLMYGLHAINSWLYNYENPFMYLKYDEDFEYLKSQIGTQYYVNILKEVLLQNNHKAIVVSEAKKGLNKETDDKVKAHLAELKASMSKEELEKIIEETRELKAYQSEPSSKEDLEKIPMLELSDIKKESKKLKNRETTVCDVPVICHDIFTNGIAYVKYVFDLKKIDISLLPYAALLAALYKEVDTEKYTYNELASEIDLKTGGIGATIGVLNATKENGDYKVFLSLNTKVLYENAADAFSLMKEILFHSKITDKKRMKEILGEMVSQMKVGIQESGHLAMSSRGMSYFSKTAYIKELVEGIAFYEFINNLYKNFDAQYEKTCEKLHETLSAFSKKSNLIISYTGDKDISKELEAAITMLQEDLNENTDDVKEQQFEPVKLNEGYKTSSKVQYVATAGNFLRAGYQYTGALNVLQVIFSYDYLWINVRVKGGAYGCMCNFGRLGDAYMVSYRDPNLSKTYEVYKNAVAYVENFDASERDMLKYIIGAIAKIDTPMTPSQEGNYSFMCYLGAVTDDEIQKIRDEILTADVEKIRLLAPIVNSVTNSDIICAMGDETIIEKNKELFDEIKTFA